MKKDSLRRQEILEYQHKAADALYAWAQSIKEVPPPSIVPEQQIVRPTAPAEGATLDEWAEFHRQMLAWIEWQRDMQAWQGNVESRLDRLESVTGRILKQIGPPRITIEHQTLVQYYVSLMHKATGKDQQTIYAALKTAFCVPRYDEISEAEWEKVEQWFKRQLPGQQLPPTQEKLL